MGILLVRHGDAVEASGDIDDAFKFVRRIENQNLKGGVRGLTGCTQTHSLYYSCTDRRMGRFDLETEKVVWENQYSGGCDRSAAMLDGSKIFAEFKDGMLTVTLPKNTAAIPKQIEVKVK